MACFGHKMRIAITNYISGVSSIESHLKTKNPEFKRSILEN